MSTQRTDIAADRPAWDRHRLYQALSTARHRGSRGARRLQLSYADREDLRQDILLAIIERSRHFDPARGAWSTFVGLVARHVIADRAREQRERPEPIFLVLDLDGFPNGSSATQQDHVDHDMPLSLRRVADELPPAPQTILRQVGAAGDLPGAQRTSEMPSATFYRAVVDLRCWLRAAGLRPERCIARREPHEAR
jgi:DNA-directed RNA polymerase specialized sigma24 family protein